MSTLPQAEIHVYGHKHGHSEGIWYHDTLSKQRSKSFTKIFSACGFAQYIKQSMNSGLHILSESGCFTTLAIMLLLHHEAYLACEATILICTMHIYKRLLIPLFLGFLKSNCQHCDS